MFYLFLYLTIPLKIIVLGPYSPIMKRIREGVDGQISKEEFHSVDNVLSEKVFAYNNLSSSLYFVLFVQVGEFSRAAPEVVSQRRLVTARRGGLTDMLQQESKKEQFLRHVAALNKSFFSWFTDLTQDKDKGKDGIDFIDGFQVLALSVIIIVVSS